MIYKINPDKIDRKILKEAVEGLRNGKVIIYPTDTAYGLGCDAANEQAVGKIFSIKGRSMVKSLPVIVADLKMAEEFFILNKKERELAKKFWPDDMSATVNSLSKKLSSRPTPSPANAGRGSGGLPACGVRAGISLSKIILSRNKGIPRLRPYAEFCIGTSLGMTHSAPKNDALGKLSLVVKVLNKSLFPKAVMASDNTVAVRVPNSLWARRLSLELERPIISTSANSSGMGVCYSLSAIKKSGMAYKDVDMILDAGKLPCVAPSTVARVRNGKADVLRRGSIRF